MSAGYHHTCALKADGTVVCWGANYVGQATPPSGTFTQVSAGASFVSSYTCGVRTDGSVVCWGSDDFGRATPPSGTFTQVDAGQYHTCALKTDGTIACWGYDNAGQATPLSRPLSPANLKPRARRSVKPSPSPSARPVRT